MSVSPGAAVLVALALLAGAGSQASAAIGPVAFPVLVSEPPAREHALAGRGPIFTQPFRSTAAVRIAADGVVDYRPQILDRKMFAGGSGLRIKAGTVFVLASFPDGPAYCAAAAPKGENLLTFFDVGLCLRDGDGDGVFDQQLVIEPTQRIRTAYEIAPQAALGGAASWTSTKLAYAPIPVQSIPSAELRISYRPTPINVRGSGSLTLEACWPAELVIAGAVKAGESLCGILAPAGLTITGIGDEVRFLKRGLGDQTVSWGSVSVRVAEPDGKPSATLISGLPAGARLVGLTAAFRDTSEYKFQRSVFGLWSEAAVGPRSGGTF